MGLRRIVRFASSILLVFSILISVTSCFSKIEDYFEELNVGVSSDVALYSYDTVAKGMNLFSTSVDLDFRDICAIYESKLYFVMWDSPKDNFSLGISIGILNLENNTINKINLGYFGSENHESVAAELFFEYSIFHDELYLNPELHEDQQFGELLADYYKYGIVSRYYNGSIYIKDVFRSVKYDIKENKVIENPIDFEDAFIMNYSFMVSDDYNSVSIRDIRTNKIKEIDLDVIARSCPQIREIVERFGNNKIMFENRTSTDWAFYEFAMNEIDGFLYVTLHFYNDYGTSLPVVLRYDFEDDRFDFCVSGNSSTHPLPIAMLK